MVMTTHRQPRLAVNSGGALRRSHAMHDVTTLPESDLPLLLPAGHVVRGDNPTEGADNELSASPSINRPKF